MQAQKVQTDQQTDRMQHDRSKEVRTRVSLGGRDREIVQFSTGCHTKWSLKVTFLDWGDGLMSRILAVQA